MKVFELIELLKGLDQDKDITIEGCNHIEIENDEDSYEIEFWYEHNTNK